MWTLFPRILTMPGEGWEKTMQHGPRPEIAVIRFLLPLSLLAAGAEFFAYLYQVGLSFTDLLVRAVITFCAFFIGYYIALVFAKIFLPKDAKDFPSSNYGKLLTLTGIASLACFRVLFMALPMLDFILEFLPLWTLFIIYRGMKMVVVSAEKQTMALGVMCIDIICSPLLVEWILSLF